VMLVLLDPVGDEKSGVSDLPHDASPVDRALVPIDRVGIPSEEDTTRPSIRAGSLRARLSEAGWREGLARLGAPQAAGPSRHPRSRQACSWPDPNPRAAAGQERSAESVPPNRRV
jgi:hypothetical protein